jgi:hypothetical protein
MFRFVPLQGAKYASYDRAKSGPQIMDFVLASAMLSRLGFVEVAGYRCGF